MSNDTDWGIVAIAIGGAIVVIVVLICDTILKLHGMPGF